MHELTPRAIKEALDQYIIGQEQAKRAVAVALRNRLRRRRLPEGLRDEVTPKNILMIGPTGVGKTEIARRIAKLVQAPFVKVEATKFTEVGYVGRDVDSMVRDLVETALRMVKAEKAEAVADQAAALAEERLLDLLAPLPRKGDNPRNPLEVFFGGGQAPPSQAEDVQAANDRRLRRKELRTRLAAGELEGEMVEIELEESTFPALATFGVGGGEDMGQGLQDLLGGLLPKRMRRRRVSVAEARRLLAQEEAQKLIDHDQAQAEAVHRAEQDGIIFLDEIDKIAGRDGGHGPDVSREGVQRDILPIVEGSTVMTKYGPVRTDHILFIAAGAFHVSKPTDLIPELQGRFPIRVELEPLRSEDLRRILTEPQSALTKQYQALLAADGIDLVFADDALDAIANVAQAVNEQMENIGARRLHTVMERLLEDLLFEAPERQGRVEITRAVVEERLGVLARNRDLSRYIL